MIQHQSIWNEQVTDLSCIRCGFSFPIEEHPTGCPRCLELKYPASLKVNYKNRSIQPSSQTGMMRYQERLPFRQFPSLGEGGTPLIFLKRLAERLEVKGFYLKNEGRNPTGSHKDRMSPLVIARAQMLQKPAVIIASSGNAGISLAAYAGFGGMRCVVITTEHIDEEIKSTIIASGAELIQTPDSMSRWHLMREWVETKDYYPATNYALPPVGSNCFGVQGYKTVAYEIVEQLEFQAPSIAIVPTSRGDLLWGIWEGFKDMIEAGWINQLPRLVVVEPVPRLTQVLKGADYRAEFPGTTNLASIAGSTVTYQAVQALVESNGTSIVVNDEEAKYSQQILAQNGCWLELSSATVWSAAEKLVQAGFATEKDVVVAIGTSHGFKKL